MTRRPVQVLVICCAVSGCAAACSETPYVFFQNASRASCDGAACDCAAGACGGAASAHRDSSIAGGSGDDASPPATTPGPNCESPRDDTVQLERLQLASSGLCAGQGPYAVLAGDPSYEILLEPCNDSLRQMWAIETLVDGGVEFRNEAVDFNLDVRFAASDDGTPLVLYDPHQLFNQRFDVLDDAADTFKLAPLHAPTKCVTEQSGGLVLLPCETGLETQTFRRIPCR